MTNVINPQSTEALGIAELAPQEQLSGRTVMLARVAKGLRGMADRVLYGIFEEPKPVYDGNLGERGEHLLGEFEAGHEFAYDVQAWGERADGTFAKITHAPLAWVAGENRPDFDGMEDRLSAKGLSDSTARELVNDSRALWKARLRAGFVHRGQQLKQAVTGRNKE